MNENIKPILWTHNTLKNGTHPVKLEYYSTLRGTSKRVRRSIGVYVNSKNWSGRYPQWVKKEDPLHQYKNEKIRKAIDEVNGSTISTAQMDFFSYFDHFISIKSNVKKKRHQYYKRTLDKLELFEKAYNYPINFDSLNETFINSFKEHLSKQGYHNNTIRMYVKIIKQVLRKALIKGLHTNRSFEDELWNVPEIPYDSIYLAESEIQKIYRTPVPQTYEKVRDLFVMGCYLGFRYEDLCTIKPMNIVMNGERKVIRLTQHKTGDLVVVPIKPIVEEILSKYNGLPTVISNQKFNVNIKAVAELAEIAVSSKITSHTMRRSFATNGYLAGIPSIDLMKITGHKSESAFLRYIKVSQDETAARLSDHAFFG